MLVQLCRAMRRPLGVGRAISSDPALFFTQTNHVRPIRIPLDNMPLMLNIINNNPFRILGLFANASKKDIISSQTKIKAFIKVGKTIVFPLDTIPGLPEVTRDMDSLSKSMKELERPVDQLKAMLFWFVELTPLDKIALNNLMSGDSGKAIEIWSSTDNASSILNRLTTYTILKDWDNIAKVSEALFSESNYTNELCSRVSDTLRYNSAKLARLYFETICNENPSVLWKIYKTSEANQALSAGKTRSAVWTSEIKKVLASYLSKRTENQFLEIQKIPKENIAERAQKVLALLKQINWENRKEVMDEGLDLSYLRDKVAEAGIQCAVELYNSTENPSKVAEIALELSMLSLETAPKDSPIYIRCKDNADALKEICSNLPPKEVAYYADMLEKHIDEFKGFKPTIELSSFFIDSCVPYLMSIRSILGANHKYYISICTRIADYALSSLISDYNKRSETLYNLLENRPADKRDSVMKSIRDLTKATVVAMYHLQFLGLSSEFKENRFNGNYKIIADTARKARALGNNLTYGMYGCEVTEQEFNDALKKFPLDERNEDDYFNGIKSLADCFAYRKVFPCGKYSRQIDAKIEEYEYKECTTLEDIARFKVRYPDSKYDIEKKREEVIFINCKTIEDYESYLSKYSTYRDSALIRIDNLRFEQCATIRDYENYIKAYPRGVHTAEARSRIEEEQVWAQCNEKKSWKYYRNYLNRYPRGKYADLALPKSISPMDRFRKWGGNNKNLLKFIGIAVMAITFIVLVWGLSGIGYLLAIIALLVVFSSFGEHKNGCGFQLVILGIGIAFGLAAYGIFSWNSKLKRQAIVDNALQELPENPDFFDYQSFFVKNESQLGNFNDDLMQKLLCNYYNASLDSCYNTLSYYSYEGLGSGLVYLEKFADSCHDTVYKEKAEAKHALLVDSLYIVAQSIDTKDGWEAYQEAVSSDDFRDSQEKKEAAGCSQEAEYGRGPLSTVIVYNSTVHDIKISFNGKEYKTLEIKPEGIDIIKLKNGFYHVTTSAPSTDIEETTETMNLLGGEYSISPTINIKLPGQYNYNKHIKPIRQ